MKVRQNLYLDRELSDALEALATGPGANKSRLVNGAIAAWLARRGTQGRRIGDAALFLQQAPSVVRHHQPHGDPGVVQRTQQPNGIRGSGGPRDPQVDGSIREGTHASTRSTTT